MTRLTKGALFLTAYAPLAGLIWIRLWTVWKDAAIGAIVIALLLLVVGWLIVTLLARGSEADVTIVTAERLSDTAPNFMLGYVLPFLLLDLDDISAVIAGASFVALLGIAYVRGGMLYANPLLTLFGYHIWRVTGRQTPGTGLDLALILISRQRDLNVCDTVRTTGDEGGIRLVK
jgi:hypothetical protein